MIQQISTLPVQPEVKPQTVNAQDPDQSFQTVLKQTSDKLNAKQDPKSDKTVKDEKSPEKEADAPVTSTDAAALNGLLAPVTPQIQELSQAPSATSVSVLAVSALTESPSGAALNLPAATADSNTKAATVSPQPKITAVADTQQNNFKSVSTPLNSAEKPAATQSVVSALTQNEVPKQTAVLQSEAAQQISTSAPQQDTVPTSRPTTGIQSSVQTAAEPTVAPAVAKSQSGQGAAEQLQQSSSQPQKAVQVSEKEVQPSQVSAFQQMMQTGNVIIKVSDAQPAAVKTVPQQLTDKITLNYKAGKPQFEMDLYPKELGKVTVKLAMQSGALTVEIAAANPKTQSLLMSSSGEIRSLLESTAHQPVQIMQPTQEAYGYQQSESGSHARQQQQQQAHTAVNRFAEDSNEATEDFLSVIQQLRMKASMV